VVEETLGRNAEMSWGRVVLAYARPDGAEFEMSKGSGLGWRKPDPTPSVRSKR